MCLFSLKTIWHVTVRKSQVKIIQLMTPEFHFLTWFVQLLTVEWSGAFGTVIIPNVCCEKRHSQTGTDHLSSCGYNQTEVCVGFFVFCNFILLIKSNITYISLIIYFASKANTNVYIFKVVCQRSVGKTIKQVCRKAVNTTKPWMV